MTVIQAAWKMKDQKGFGEEKLAWVGLKARSRMSHLMKKHSSDRPTHQTEKDFSPTPPNALWPRPFHGGHAQGRPQPPWRSTAARPGQDDSTVPVHPPHLRVSKACPLGRSHHECGLQNVPQGSPR